MYIIKFMEALIIGILGLFLTKLGSLAKRKGVKYLRKSIQCCNYVIEHTE